VKSFIGRAGLARCWPLGLVWRMHFGGEGARATLSRPFFRFRKILSIGRNYTIGVM